MSAPTAVSLFAGVEGIGLAFCRAGFRVVAAVEIDHAARGVIADRMPGTALFTDVCEVTADELLAAGFDPRGGVLLAGWPCQDLSVAGGRLGLGGARSGLFFEVVRLLAGLRPRWFCLENVAGLLSAVCPCPGRPDSVCGGPCADEPHRMRGGACGPGRCMQLHGGAMGAVVGTLAGLGYGLAYRVLDAQHFGVPQRRRRVVIVGCAGDWAAPVQVLLEPESRGGDPPPGAAAGPRAARVAALSASSGGADDNDATGGRLIGHETGPGWWKCGPATGPLRAGGDQDGTVVVGPLQATGAGGRGHRIDAEGAANGHLVATTPAAGSHPTRDRRCEDDLNLVPTVAAKWAKGTGGPAGDEAQNLIAFTVQGEHSTAMTGHGVAAVARPIEVVRSLDTTGGYAANQGGTVIAFDVAQITHPENRVNPQPGDPAMPLAATGQPHVAYTVRAEPGGSGNGHDTNYVAETLRSHPRPGSNSNGAMVVTHAHMAEGHDAGEDGSERGAPPVPIAAANTTAVRRLTPTECERLQGLPDGWTATSWGRPQSDSPRYRQLGNAVAVPVFEWVARRIRWQAGSTNGSANRGAP